MELHMETAVLLVLLHLIGGVSGYRFQTVCRYACSCSEDADNHLYKIECDELSKFNRLIDMVQRYDSVTDFPSKEVDKEASGAYPNQEVQLTIKDNSATKWIANDKCDGTNNENTACTKFSKKFDKNLKISQLIMTDLPRLQSLGTNADPIFVLFPDLREITISLQNEEDVNLDIFFTDLPFLDRIKLATKDNWVKVHCALQIGGSDAAACFPYDYLGKFEFKSEGKSFLEFSDTFILPQTIHEFTYYREQSEDTNKQPKWKTDVFKDREFHDIDIKYDAAFPIESFRGVVVTGALKVATKSSWHAGKYVLLKAVDQVLKAGLQSKLKLGITTEYALPQLHVPIAFTSKQEFPATLLDPCDFSRILLSKDYSQSDLYDDGVFVYRGHEVKVSSVMDEAEKHLSQGATVTDIHVFAVFLVVDVEFTDHLKNAPRRGDQGGGVIEKPNSFQKVLLHYVELKVDRSHHDSKAAEYYGLDKYKTLVDLTIESENSDFLSYDSHSATIIYNALKTQFIHMMYAEQKDPVFVTASAMCLASAIDGYRNDNPFRSIKENKILTEWANQLLDVDSFHARYATTGLTNVRALAVSRTLMKYMALVEDQGAVTKVPLLSLSNLASNLDVLTQSGRYFQEKERDYRQMVATKKLEQKTVEQINSMSEHIRKDLLKLADKIDESTASLLEENKKNSETFANIEIRKQKDMMQSINESLVFLQDVNTKFDDYKEKLKTATEDFQAGAKVATALAAAEVVAETVGAFLSIFSGGFNPSGLMKAVRAVANLAKMIKRMVKIMKNIHKLLKKGKVMKRLFKALRTWKSSFFPKLKMSFKTYGGLAKNFILKKPVMAMDVKSWSKIQEMNTKLKGFVGEKGPINTAKGMVDSIISTWRARITLKAGYDPGEQAENTTNQKWGITNKEIGEMIKRLDNASKALDGDPEKLIKTNVTKDILKTDNQMKPVDLFEWEIARENVIATVDTTLSDTVPEATAYRAALLKFIKAGTTRTEVEIELSTKQSKYALSKDVWEMHIRQAVQTGKKIVELKKQLDRKEERSIDNVGEVVTKVKNVTDLEYRFESFTLIFAAVQVNLEFCNAYYYFHLEKCSDDLRLDMSDTLEKVLMVQTELSFRSREKLADIYPLPQTFVDRTITINAKPAYCECMTDKSLYEDVAPKDVNKAYEILEQCLRDKGKRVTATEQPGENAADEQPVVEYTDADKIDNVQLKFKLTKLMRECADDIIQQVKDQKKENVVSFSYEIKLDSELFDHHDRVRIDDVKVFLKGVTTDNGVVQMIGETTGISLDKYQGKCFKFIDEKWIRRIAYYSKNAIGPAPGRSRRGAEEPEEPPKKPRRTTQILRIVKNMEKKMNDMENKLDDMESKLRHANNDNNNNDNNENDKMDDEGVYYLDRASVHKNFEGLYRLPTAFTTWTFKILRDQNPGLELDGLNQIKIQLSGSFVDNNKKNFEHASCALGPEEEETTEPEKRWKLGHGTQH